MNNQKLLIKSIIIAFLLMTACTTPTMQAGPDSTTGQVDQSLNPTKAFATTSNGEPESPQTSQMPSTSEEATSLVAKLSLKEAMANLKPRDVFQNFYAITQVPRPSGQVDQIQGFLIEFGEGLGLETLVDEAGNILIRKPAAPGMENRQGVVLQAHMDMVPQSVEGMDFDFTREPIQAFVSGDYIVTNGTTLGADDGIGMAMIMSILQSDTLKSGPLEALFTVDEETTMSGANSLRPDFLQGRILINLDGEEEGVFTIGSAGGGRVNSNFNYKQTPAPVEMASYLVKIQGLQGGHSGLEINKGRGHATKLLVRLLKVAEEPYGVRLASLIGGTVSNAIPREASAVVFLPESQIEAFTEFVKVYLATVRTELAATEPELEIQLTAVQPPAQVMELEFQKNLLNGLYGTPQGVVRMSDTVPGLVETSNNLGVVNIQDGQAQLVCYSRSSVDSELQDVAQMISSVWELAMFPVDVGDWYSGWTPNPASQILGLMQSTYKEIYAVEPTVSALHAGLECGTIGGKYPDMEMVSIGPNLENVHSPSERLYIPSVEKLMKFLYEVLQAIPEG